MSSLKLPIDMEPPPKRISISVAIQEMYDALGSVACHNNIPFYSARSWVLVRSLSRSSPSGWTWHYNTPVCPLASRTLSAPVGRPRFVRRSTVPENPIVHGSNKFRYRMPNCTPDSTESVDVLGGTFPDYFDSGHPRLPMARAVLIPAFSELRELFYVCELPRCYYYCLLARAVNSVRWPPSSGRFGVACRPENACKMGGVGEGAGYVFVTGVVILELEKSGATFEGGCRHRVSHEFVSCFGAFALMLLASRELLAEAVYRLDLAVSCWERCQ